MSKDNHELASASGNDKPHKQAVDAYDADVGKYQAQKPAIAAPKEAPHADFFAPSKGGK